MSTLWYDLEGSNLDEDAIAVILEKRKHANRRRMNGYDLYEDDDEIEVVVKPKKKKKRFVKTEEVSADEEIERQLREADAFWREQLDELNDMLGYGFED